MIRQISKGMDGGKYRKLKWLPGIANLFEDAACHPPMDPKIPPNTWY